jgi:hypothetical protein
MFSNTLSFLSSRNDRHTLRVLNTYCFCMAINVTWTRLNIMLYEYCLSW